MNGYGRLWTLAIGTGQLLAASKIHSKYGLQLESPKQISPPKFYIPTWEFCPTLYFLLTWLEISQVVGYGCIYSTYTI